MRTTLLNPAQIAFLDATFARNRARFGGWRMDAADDAAKAAADAAAAKEAADKAAADAAAKPFEAITSQDEFDRRLSARLAREREKFSDYDALKAKAEAHDQALEEAKTEQDKAVDAARKEGETTATQAADRKIVRAEAKALAGTMAFRDPADAVAFLDLSKVKVDDNGDADAEALKGLLAKLAEDKPYLVDDGKSTSPRRGPKPDKSAGGGNSDTSTGIARGRELRAGRRPKAS